MFFISTNYTKKNLPINSDNYPAQRQIFMVFPPEGESVNPEVAFYNFLLPLFSVETSIGIIMFVTMLSHMTATLSSQYSEWYVFYTESMPFYKLLKSNIKAGKWHLNKNIHLYSQNQNTDFSFFSAFLFFNTWSHNEILSGEGDLEHSPVRNGNLTQAKKRTTEKRSNLGLM